MKNIILIFVIFVGSNLIGQENSPKTLADSLKGLNIDDLYMDFSIPKVTAFSLLNVDPSNILKPGAVKKFAIGAGTFADSSGTGKSGIAAEWSPFLTFSQTASGWSKVFEPKNLSFSFATVGNGSTGNMGLAFKWAPIDFTNPLKTKGGRDSIYAILNEIRKKEDLSQIINKDMAVFNSEYFQFLETLKIQDNEEAKDEISKIIDVSDSFVRDELVEKYNITDGDIQQDTLANWLKKDLKKILEPRIINEMTLEINNLTNLAASLLIVFVLEENAIKKIFLNEMVDFKTDFKKKNWNKMALEVGGGQILSSPNARFSELAANYSTFYLSFATPLMWNKNGYNKFVNYLRNNSQLILHVRTQNYYAPDSTQNNNVFAGARLLIGTPDWHFSLEGGYIWQANFVTGLDQSYLQYAFGFDYRISDGNWIEFALGGAQTLSNTGRLELSLLPRIAFRHAFQKESRFD